ncbi:MarR family winged helix-turn-helix transcriptional regulator [Actinoplanes sp. CA-030573]|uniref:MarR family winged helix-turn-helix transcriptional regulator n=1 Tax=Actinoplanes sp. CA-030573 TaxID=3239898 RepID=UPI003D8DDAD1
MEQLPSWLLTQTAAHAGRLVHDGFAEVGARGYHYRLLNSLLEEGPASQADLGRRTGIHLSDMVAALNELQREGYVAREPDPADRRRNVITLTRPGRLRAAELTKRAHDVQERLLAPLTEAERGQLLSTLVKLLDHHLRQGIPPLPKE